MTVIKVSRWAAFLFVCILHMSFRKEHSRRHRHNDSDKVARTSSTFIDARLSYDKRGSLIKMDMGNGRYHVFTYPDRATVRVRYVQGPAFENRFTEEVQTETKIDRFGYIISSRSYSPHDTTTLYLTYDRSRRISVEIKAQGGVVPTMTRIGGRDTSYFEPYSYTDSTVYSWKDGNLEEKHVYRNGRSVSETRFYYDDRYGGNQHAPYNSGYSMLASVTEISGMTCYKPYLSKSLKSKEVLIKYGGDKDTISTTTTVYGSVKVNRAGRLTTYDVRESEDIDGQNRGISFDRFIITYKGR